MKSKHYMVVPSTNQQGWTVVCLAHDVITGVKREEADAMANALNLESCHTQEGFGE